MQAKKRQAIVNTECYGKLWYEYPHHMNSLCWRANSFKHVQHECTYPDWQLHNHWNILTPHLIQLSSTYMPLVASVVRHTDMLKHRQVLCNPQKCFLLTSALQSTEASTCHLSSILFRWQATPLQVNRAFGFLVDVAFTAEWGMEYPTLNGHLDQLSINTPAWRPTIQTGTGWPQREMLTKHSCGKL